MRIGRYNGRTDKGKGGRTDKNVCSTGKGGVKSSDDWESHKKIKSSDDLKSSDDKRQTRMSVLLVGVMIGLLLFSGIAWADTLSVDTTTYICVNYGDSLLCVGGADKDSTVFRADIMICIQNKRSGGIKRDVYFFYVQNKSDTVRMATVGLVQYNPKMTTKDRKFGFDNVVLPIRQRLEK